MKNIKKNSNNKKESYFLKRKVPAIKKHSKHFKNKVSGIKHTRDKHEKSNSNNKKDNVEP